VKFARLNLLAILVVLAALSATSAFAAQGDPGSTTGAVEKPSEESRFKFSAEGDARYVIGNSDYRGGVIDGTELGVLAEVSKGIRAKGLLAFQLVCDVNKSKGECPKDWQRFLREAYVQFDLNELIQNGPNMSVLVGRMEIESAPSDSALAVDSNSPMFGVTRVRTAYAIKVVIDTTKSKIVDEVTLSAINTGPNDGDIQGDLEQKNVSGGMVTMTKTVLNRLTLSLGITHLNYKPKAETRINANAAFQITPEWKVFVNGEETTYSPLYGDSKFAATVGTAFDTKKAYGGLEFTRVDKQFKQVAFGYMWKITPTLSTGFEARHDWCDKGSTVCAKNNSRLTMEAHYSLNQIDDAQAKRVQPDHCAVGEPGCIPDAKPFQNEQTK
jgi:hypothetical protein